MTFRDIEPYLLGFYQVHDLNDNVLDFDEDAELLDKVEIDNICSGMLYPSSTGSSDDYGSYTIITLSVKKG